ncbi:hypothetical protein ABZ897_27070 [Nonomuraea sp. NPDC046802]|uniref:hypothetical protein n=1 Tax=Nonomuraea sp. NPDC046802 TaxID=3154919 RepID=UPI0033C04E9C
MKVRTRLTALGLTAALGIGLSVLAPATSASASAAQPCGYQDVNYIPFYYNCKNEPREILIDENIDWEPKTRTLCVPANTHVRLSWSVYITISAVDTGKTCRP